MTDTQLVDLQGRLSRLAAAVPVDIPASAIAPSPNAPVAVVRRASISRNVAVGAFGPLVVVIGVFVLSGLAGVGPKAPGATARSPVSAAVRDGAFELSITSAKARYAVGDSIGVTASLVFDGPEPSVLIGHGEGSPMAFGVIERVNDFFLTPAWRESCEHTKLERGIPLVRPFAKSGSFFGDDPAASDAAAFFEDPTLMLPAGTWHLYVVADFGVGECGLDRHLMRADIEIVVGDGPVDPHPTSAPSDLPTAAPEPTSSPSAPAETPPPSLPAPTNAADAPVSSSADDGPATLQLTADQAVYAEGTPIDLEVAYSFRDGQGLVASFYQPEVYLMLTQLDATHPTSRGTSYDTACTDLGRVDGTRRRVALTGFNVTRMTADTVPGRLDDLFVDGTLRLPVGRWEIGVDVEGAFAPCDRGVTSYESYALETSIVIEVVAR